MSNKPVLLKIVAMQITGAYSESASDEQNAALKQVALKRPDAPSKDELQSMGYDFALKVQQLSS